LWCLEAYLSLHSTTLPKGTSTSFSIEVLSYGSGKYLPIHYVLSKPFGRLSASSSVPYKPLGLPTTTSQSRNNPMLFEISGQQ
jgi:hypothetical protein